MARGRMISNEITRDKRINDLADDTSRLAFTWLVTFADREGRTYGDPALVRSMLFPRRTDISVEQMESYIQEWHNLELIMWYEAENDLWIAFPNFDKHQIGLRKDREAESAIPEPPGYMPPVRTEGGDDNPDNDGSNSGVSPEAIPVKLIKVKEESNINGMEEELTTPTPHSLLSVTFVNKTSIPEFNGGAKRWNEATRRMVKAGVEPIDVETAVDELLGSDKNYTIVSIASVENAAISAMAKRKNSKGKRDRVVDDSPERRRKYAEDLAKYQ